MSQLRHVVRALGLQVGLAALWLGATPGLGFAQPCPPGSIYSHYSGSISAAGGLSVCPLNDPDYCLEAAVYPTGHPEAHNLVGVTPLPGGSIDYYTSVAVTWPALVFYGTGPGYRTSFENAGGSCTDYPPNCWHCEGSFGILLFPIWVREPEMRHCPGSPGAPVNVITGNVWFDHTDAVVSGIVGLGLTRSYNSLNARNNIAGALGKGWSHTYERSLSFPTTSAIEFRGDDGVPLYFEDFDGNLTFLPWLPKTERSSIVKSGSTYVRTLLGGSTETYDSSGRLVSLTDATGNVTTIERDSSAKLIRVVDPGSRALSFSYDGNGRLTGLSGPAGTIAAYAYDPSGLLSTVSYPDGSGYAFAYDGLAQILTVSDFTGRILESHSYSGGMGVTSEISGGREKLTFSYMEGKTDVTDALGNATSYTWQTLQGHKRITKVEGPCGECGSGSQTQEFSYDTLGRKTSYKDSLGKIWSYTYSANHDLLTETNPLSQVTSYTYDSQGRVLTRSGPGGSLTTYTHAPSGPLTITEKVTTSTNRTTSITYNGQGKPSGITDPRGKLTILAYSGSGDLTSLTDPLSHATGFGYDGLGRRTTVTDAINHTTTTVYDARGRVARITNHDGTHSDFAYDLGGRRTSVTDPLFRVTRYAYDPYGRLDSVVDPLNGVTRYGYDLMSNLTSLTDAKGQTTTFEYDGYNRVKKVIYPGGAFETLTYNAAGRLATKTDRKAVVTTYSYDDLGRLTGKTYSNGDPAVSYTYSAAGQLATAANGTDTLTWTYDLAGQLLTEQSTKNSSTVAYAYDDGGSRLSISLDGQVFVTYAFDDASRLTTITRGTNAFGFGYDNANRRTSLSYPNGVNTTYTYDSLDRLTNLSAVKTPTTITSSTYAYDNAGNRTSKQQLDFTEAYTYDKLYRLTEVSRTGGSTGHWLYSYDAVGNRLSEQIGNTVSSLTYNSKNQLLSTMGGGPLRWRGTLNEAGNVAFTTVTVNGQPARMLAGNVFEADLQMAAGNNTVTVVATDVSGNTTTKDYQVNVTGSAATYTYDANGNLTQKVEGADTWGYEWNAENQLTRVTKNSIEQARFKYDPLGRRVEKVAGGVTTGWTYDAEDILREISGGNTLKYVHGQDVDEPLATDDGSTLVYFQADGLGSVVKATNPSGAVSFSRQYDAWGGLQAGAVNGYAFTGREWDPEAGLYYYRARYYDPKIGRFISEDSVRYLDGTSLYGYVLGNPVRLVDPSGHAAELPCGGPCPPIVTDGRERLCDQATKIPDVAVRRCILQRCGYYPRPIRMTCDSPECGQGRYGHNTGGRRNSIVICSRNQPAPGSGPPYCVEQTIAHEMLHSCLPGGPEADPTEEATIRTQVQGNIRCLSVP